MIPKSEIKEKPEAPIVVVDPKSRDIKPHVANLVITKLREVSEEWWAEIQVMLRSKSILDRKFAITEINKVQLKAMPTQLNADEGVSLNVNIVNYGNETNPDTVQLHPKEVSGTVIEGDGQWVSESSGSVAQKKR